MTHEKVVVSRLGKKYYTQIVVLEEHDKYHVRIYDKKPHSRLFDLWSKMEPILFREFDIKVPFVKSISEMVDHIELHENHKRELESWSGYLDVEEAYELVEEEHTFDIHDSIANKSYTAKTTQLVKRSVVDA